MKTVIRRSANHPLHLFLSLITLGLWVPVWIVVAIVGRRETVTVPDSAPQHWPVPHAPPPWTGGTTSLRWNGRNWLWNPWTNRWDRTL